MLKVIKKYLRDLIFLGKAYRNFKAGVGVLEFEGAAGLLGDVFYDVQAEAGTVFAAAVFTSVKFVGDERHVFVRDAAAFVGEGDLDVTVFLCH